ncbi:MAG: hypothetical protein V2A72_05195 [Candidatus Omnitrophota bacterium]
MDERKLINKNYKVRTFTKMVFLSAFLLSAIAVPFSLSGKLYFLFALSIICGIGCLVAVIELHFFRIVLTKDSVTQLYRYPTRKYEIRFDEIEKIVDDDISLLGLKKIHAYHLIPREGLKKNFKRFTIHEGIKNRNDLLSEVLYRIRPDTQIEQTVLNFVEEYRKM